LRTPGRDDIFHCHRHLENATEYGESDGQNADDQPIGPTGSFDTDAGFNDNSEEYSQLPHTFRLDSNS